MDIALVTRAQHGDEEAFATLAAAIGDRLNAVAHRILRGRPMAWRCHSPRRKDL